MVKSFHGCWMERFTTFFFGSASQLVLCRILVSRSSTNAEIFTAFRVVHFSKRRTANFRAPSGQTPAAGSRRRPAGDEHGRAIKKLNRAANCLTRKAKENVKLMSFFAVKSRLCCSFMAWKMV